MSARPPLPYAWAEIRARLQADLPNLLDRWNLRHELPGRPSGGKIFPRSPFRADRRAGSFVVWTNGDAAGAYKDYAAPACRGDVLDLVGGMERLASKIDVYWWALDWLGLDRGAATGRARGAEGAALERQRRELERQAADARRRAGDAAKSRALTALWLKCAPLTGSPAERFLRETRGIDLARLAKPPDAIRWASTAEWVNSETGEVSEWRNVMLTAMTRGSRIMALHRTWLTPDGMAKARGGKSKTMIGPVSGAAIRLTRGPSGLSPARAAERGHRGPLAIGEGIETALTVAAARPDYRVWAAGSLSLMGLLDWPPCANAVVLLRDNDWSPAARAEFGRVEAHWRARAAGRPVVVAASRVGSDFNDMVKPWAVTGTLGRAATR